MTINLGLLYRVQELFFVSIVSLWEHESLTFAETPYERATYKRTPKNMNNLIAFNRKIQDSLTEAQPQAEQDPARPMYHFRPTALWMNDPNGPIYHNGWYHLFYQFHPYSDGWGSMHWGHARSRDLVRWEHLPIALFPGGWDEAHCASGCTIVNANGIPMIFYTSFTDRLEEHPYQQRVMCGDEELLTWQPHPRNPLFGENAWDMIGIQHNWRDPFIFREAGRTFLILGAETEKSWQIPIYETKDPECVDWTYRGVLYEIPKHERQTQFLFECPNFTKIGEKWVLLYSPMIMGVEYGVGTFDVDTLTFHPERQGVLDKGFQHETGLYATNMFFDPDGNCILMGWIRGFPPQKGWNGCLSLPRVLSLGEDGHPRQMPVAALQQLRQQHAQRSVFLLEDTSRNIAGIRGDQLEILIELEPGDAQEFGLRIRCSEDGSRAVHISYNGQTLNIDGNRIPFSLRSDDILKLHLFLDHSVLEVFVNDGRECLTRIIDTPPEDLGIHVFAYGGRITVNRLEVWKMQSIW